MPLVLNRFEPASGAEQPKEATTGLSHNPAQTVEHPQKEGRTAEDEDQYDDQRFNWHDGLPLSCLQHPQVISAENTKAVVRVDDFMA